MSSHKRILKSTGPKKEKKTFNDELKDTTLELKQHTYDTIQLHSGNVMPHLLNCMKTATSVVGCVAWLTHPEFLEVLCKKKHVSILVQKEYFLKTNSRGPAWKHKWSEQLIEKYSKLPSWTTKDWKEWRGTDTSSVVRKEPEAIRCVGWCGSSKTKTNPRFHHKFLVFCEGETPSPYAVWTGSMNITKNGTLSRENGIYIKDKTTAKFYFDEWKQMTELSEPLNWKSKQIKAAPTADK